MQDGPHHRCPTETDSLLKEVDPWLAAGNVLWQSATFHRPINEAHQKGDHSAGKLPPVLTTAADDHGPISGLPTGELPVEGVPVKRLTSREQPARSRMSLVPRCQAILGEFLHEFELVPQVVSIPRLVARVG